MDVLESLNASKVEAVFHKNMEKMTKTLDNYYEVNRNFINTI